MTTEQKDIVRQLREQGCGYKKISNITGIHRETIKSYLKRHPCVVSPSQSGLSQYKTRKTGSREASGEVEILLCKQCGKPIIQDSKRKAKLFCCDECRHIWWNKNRHREGGTPHTFICLGCRKEFQAFGSKERKYCSHDCYIEARFGAKPQPAREDSGVKTVSGSITDNAPKLKNSKKEVKYRLAKWIIRSLEEEQLLEPDEIEEIWTELLSFYAPPTASVENVCGTMIGSGLGKYVMPGLDTHTENPQNDGEAGDQDG